MIEIPADEDKGLVLVEAIKANEWQNVWEEDVWEKVLIVSFFNTSPDVDAMMVSVFDKIFAMLAVLDVLFFLARSGLDWWVFGLCFKGDLSRLGVRNFFMGLVRKI